MDFTLPEDLRLYLAELDEFIEREIRPLEEQDDNIRFFDHRREDARTDWDRGGLPSREWEALLAEARRRADAAGHYRYAFPRAYGGRDGTNLGMAVDAPLSGISSVGSDYGGTRSGWATVPAGTTTYTAQTAWPAPAKLELALAKGKKLHDKREATAERDWQRDKARLMREKG